MATTSRTKKTKSAQQWAWEFLRRNPAYRDAFRRLTEQSPEQFGQLAKIAVGEGSDQLDEEVVRKLDVRFFETSVLIGFKEKQTTVGEYIDQSQRIRDSLDEPEIDLTLAPNFKLETYSLAKWYDPEVELQENDVADMWHPHIPFELGLTPAPWAFAHSVDNASAIDKYSGWPVRTSEKDITPKVDKRRRKSPCQLSTPVPLVKGVDDSIFLTFHRDVAIHLNQTQAGFIFDLSLPVDFQLSQAKEILEQHQDALVRGGFVQSLPKQADRFGTFSEYLEILDLLATGLSHLDIAKKIDGLITASEWRHDPKANRLVKVPKIVSRSKHGAPVNELTQAVRKKIERAIGLRDHGYRALAFTE